MRNKFRLLIALVGILVLLRVIFPPLTVISYSRTSFGDGFQIMIDLNEGVDPLKVYIKWREEIPFMKVSYNLCEKMIEDRAEGLQSFEGMPETGKIEFRFVTGGRYFYRFSDEVLVIASYNARNCYAMRKIGGSFP